MQTYIDILCMSSKKIVLIILLSVIPEKYRFFPVRARLPGMGIYFHRGHDSS